MKKIITILSILLLPLTLNAEVTNTANVASTANAKMQPPAVSQATSASLYAVSFYADWCGNCKVLDPNIEKAIEQANLKNKSVLFVKLDLTDDASTQQARLLADALGISEIYQTNSGRTGFVLLIDAKDKKTVATITQRRSIDDIVTDIEFYL